jgi:hypothetical protein
VKMLIFNLCILNVMFKWKTELVSDPHHNRVAILTPH